LQPCRIGFRSSPDGCHLEHDPAAADLKRIKKRLARRRGFLIFSSRSAVKHFGQPISFVPREDWRAWDRAKKAYFTLLYRAAPNFAVAAEAAGTDGETVSSHIDNAGIPWKKHKRKGKMAPPPEELWRMVEAAEATPGTPGNLSVTPLTNAAPASAVPGHPAPANAAPESASLLVPLEPEPGARQKLTGLYPNLEVTVSVRKSEHAGAQS
jgi:hypothetical protein